MGIPLWRDVAIVILAVEIFVLALVPLAIVFLLNRLMKEMRSSVRPVFPRALGRVQQVEWITLGVSDAITSHIISAYSLAARVRTTASSLLAALAKDMRR